MIQFIMLLIETQDDIVINALIESNIFEKIFTIFSINPKMNMLHN